MAEGISPLGTLYMDGKYIDSLQKKFGTQNQNIPKYEIIIFHEMDNF